jgi:hypothetical protein
VGVVGEVIVGVSCGWYIVEVIVVVVSRCVVKTTVSSV